jgi:D-tyrosyl-tRNA(Tyr) deacylase
MIAIIQRARDASVQVDTTTVGSIDHGMVVLLGVAPQDDSASARKLAGKIARLRIFADSEGVPNLSMLDTGDSALVISQFTLLADTRKGNRPSYGGAAKPDRAEELYLCFVDELRELVGQTHVETGRFGAMMDVRLINEGPYTLILNVE